MSPTTPTWTRTRRRAARTVVALVAGAALLSGCAQAPGTAAVVDGRTISEGTLQRATEDLGQLVPQGIPTQQVLINLVAAPFLLERREGGGRRAEPALRHVRPHCRGGDPAARAALDRRALTSCPTR